MGFAPPPDAPPPAVQAASSAGAAFAAGPTVDSLCGFALPSLSNLFKFPALPAIPNFPPPLPIPRLSLGLNCSTDNPIDITAGIAYGGGRLPTSDPNPDLALDSAT
jgi:hypothetical protein